MSLLLIFAVVVALLLVGTVIWMGRPRGPSLAEVAHLRSPEILGMDPQKVLQVRAKGNPNDVGRKAFGLLMKTYFGLKGVPKGGPSLKPPRARWPVGAGIPMEEWVGLYAMPVPDGVTELSGGESDGDLTVELVTWEYGEVAQILHVGRYDEEIDDTETLLGFIRSQGYEVTGLHEEEYLKGPGFLFAGNPDNYLTIIRYPVRKIDFGRAP
jgi:effector-binding domain-containing protein